MDTLFNKLIAYQIIMIFFIALILMGIAKPAISYYGSPYYMAPPIPTWGSNINVGQNNWWGGSYYTGAQTYSDPYLYGPALGVYYPYNTRFNIYNQNYAYGSNAFGYYNTGAGAQDVDAFGYPYPYAYANQMAWNNQAGYMGYPPMGNSGNIFNVSYNPRAFTVDLGIDAYYTGISNFWKKVFQDLNEEDD